MWMKIFFLLLYLASRNIRRFMCTLRRKQHCFSFIIYMPFWFFFQGETNQGNRKIYQRTVGRKIFMLFHINLNPFSMNVFKTFFSIVCFWFFSLFYGQYLYFQRFFSTHNFFIHCFYRTVLHWWWILPSVCQIV